MKQHITTQVHVVNGQQVQLELHVDHDAIIRQLGVKAAAAKGGSAKSLYGAVEVKVVAHPARPRGAPSLK